MNTSDDDFLKGEVVVTQVQRTALKPSDDLFTIHKTRGCFTKLLNIHVEEAEKHRKTTVGTPLLTDRKSVV